jgi:two-component system response regulator AlgR
MSVAGALVVDDEALARSRMRTAAGRLHGRLQSSVDGEAANADDSAIELAAPPELVDVALLDIHMPGADGLTLAQMLRSLAPGASGWCS